MNTALSKTKALVRKDLPIASLVGNELNPNSMSDVEFNLLYDNFEKTGLTDPILVRELPDGKYRIVGGHHRVEVAKLHDFTDVPCTIITDPDFDEDQEKFQVVRMNVIRGKMSPDKFMKLYQSLGDKYTDEILKDAFGFAEEAEFRKMVKQVQKDLPPEVQQAFKDASKNIKTIDDLSKVLNTLFTTHGDTLKHGYMVFDYGGKQSVWIRATSDTLKAVYGLGEVCRDKKRTMESLIGGVLQLIAQGDLQEVLDKVVASTPEVFIPEEAIELPTEDFLASLGS